MSSVLIFIFFGLFLLFQPSNASFDYYMLSQQWPGSIRSILRPEAMQPSNASFDYYIQPCNIPYPAADFTLHGLWPQNRSNPQPEFCIKGRAANFVPSLLSPIRSTLDNEWPNLTGKNEGFWDFEWRKHGVCSTFATQQEKYFDRALKIKASISNLTAILEKANIVPSANQQYDREKIVIAVHSVTHAWPQLLVVLDRPKLPTPSLLEIRVCVNLNYACIDGVKNCTGYTSQMVSLPV